MESSSSSIEQANINHFNKLSVNYDNNPFVDSVSRQIANKIKKSFQFDEQSTILLDYACGTG